MLHPFPPPAGHNSRTASASASSSEHHTSLSSLLSGADYILHGDHRSSNGLQRPIHDAHSKFPSIATIKMQDLPLEILQHIYRYLPDIESVLALSSTSHQFRRAYIGSQKLVIVERVLETQFGPLHDVTQVVTLNSSQPAHQARHPNFSVALAKQIVEKGRVANKWADLYPILRWRVRPENRRFLDSSERYRLRRAIYRFWLYNAAACIDFDDDQHTFLDYLARLRVIRQYPTREIRELEELERVFEDMLAYDCCPSDSTIQRHYNQNLPTRDLLDFGRYRGNLKGRSVRELLVHESWGDNDHVMYEVAHLMRMAPDQLLHFREVCTGKAERERYIEKLTEWESGLWDLYESPSTLWWDVSKVLGERGDDEKRGQGRGQERQWITGNGDEGGEEGDEKDDVDEKFQSVLRLIRGRCYAS